jgi:hypothetical protein
MFALVMPCTTATGDAYPLAELRAMFDRAGFSASVPRTPGPAGPRIVISDP